MRGISIAKPARDLSCYDFNLFNNSRDAFFAQERSGARGAHRGDDFSAIIKNGGGNTSIAKDVLLVIHAPALGAYRAQMILELCGGGDSIGRVLCELVPW